MMLIYKITLWLFLVLICNGAKVFGNEIINGEKAEDGSLLYMASVQMNNKHKCGGFLISENFVVTAAHCAGNGLSVVLGTHNIRNADKLKRYQVTQQIKHPDYTNNISEGNDIMLLKLSGKASPSKTLQPIQLPHQGSIINENTVCLVAGWGNTESNMQPVSALLVVNVSTITWEDCQRQWQVLNIILPLDVICAGGYNSEKGFCQGDSGGPLVCDGKVAGVVSFNYNQDCNYPNFPNVFTSIANYISWINKIIHEESYSIYSFP